MNRNKSGFSLIELLVVIAIIGIIAALVTPSIGNSLKKSKSVQALSGLRQLGVANFNFGHDNDDRINGYGELNSDSDNTFQNRYAQIIIGKSLAALDDLTDIKPLNLGLRDANVPLAICADPNTAGTWAVNDLFSVTVGKLLKITAFDKLSNLLYLTSGAVAFNNGGIKDMPSSTRNGIYYSYKEYTPAVYLDGHSELLPFGFDAGKITPP